jgi:hypothetical protein
MQGTPLYQVHPDVPINPQIFSEDQVLYTLVGDRKVSELDITVGRNEDEQAITHWRECRLKGESEIVKRDIHVLVKQGAAATPEQATM